MEAGRHDEADLGAGAGGQLDRLPGLLPGGEGGQRGGEGRAELGVGGLAGHRQLEQRGREGAPVGHRTAHRAAAVPGVQRIGGQCGHLGAGAGAAVPAVTTVPSRSTASYTGPLGASRRLNSVSAAGCVPLRSAVSEAAGWREACGAKRASVSAPSVAETCSAAAKGLASVVNWPSWVN